MLSGARSDSTICSQVRRSRTDGPLQSVGSGAKLALRADCGPMDPLTDCGPIGVASCGALGSIGMCPSSTFNNLFNWYFTLELYKVSRQFLMSSIYLQDFTYHGSMPDDRRLRGARSDLTVCNQVWRSRPDGQLQSVGTGAKLALRADCGPMDLSARAMWPQNLRWLVWIMLVSGGWSVSQQRTYSLELQAHRGIHKHRWSKASRFLISCRVGDQVPASRRMTGKTNTRQSRSFVGRVTKEWRVPNVAIYMHSTMHGMQLHAIAVCFPTAVCFPMSCSVDPVLWMSTPTAKLFQK